MTSFLLIISFLLHIILLISVYQLNQQLQKVKKEANEEIEDVLVAFLEEMKLENEQLKKTLTKDKKEAMIQPIYQHLNNQKHDQKQTKPIKEEQYQTEDRIQTPIDFQKKQANQHFKKTIDFEEPILPIDQLMKKQSKDIVEQSEEGKIISMYEQGLAIEEIAKKLKRGKTEVELIVKMGSKQHL